eukprot:4694281-Amphidinium_carterae.1
MIVTALRVCARQRGRIVGKIPGDDRAFDGNPQMHAAGIIAHHHHIDIYSIGLNRIAQDSRQESAPTSLCDMLRGAGRGQCDLSA